jgi:hypothetical protein
MWRLLQLSLCALLVACAPSGVVKLDSSAASAPPWRLQPPSGNPSTVYSVGTAQGVSERFAVEHARGDAARQLVIKHYGVRIASILQTGQAQETTGTLNNGEFEGATAVKEHVIDTITQSASGTVKGLEVSEIYTERWNEDGRDVHKAWILAKVNRQLMDTTVRETIERSPTMVEARALEVSSKELVLDIERLSREAKSAGAQTRFKEMQGHVAAVSEKHAGLEGARSRYQALLGRELPADLARAAKELEATKQAWSVQMRSMRVAVVVTSVDPSGTAEAKSAVMKHLEIAKIPATEAPSGCPHETAFWLRIEVGTPGCKRPGMGISCELPLVANLGRCGEATALDTKTLSGIATRGAAMDEAKAKAKAWAKISDPKNAEFRALLESLIGRHLPLDMLGESR